MKRDQSPFLHRLQLAAVGTTSDGILHVHSEDAVELNSNKHIPLLEFI